MNTLDEWNRAVATALGLDPDQLVGADRRDLVLDLARDVAHGVARPAAPLTTFLLGLAAGRAGGGDAAISSAAATIREQAAGWSPAE